MSWLASQFPCEVSLFLCGARNKSMVFFCSPQCESALQRRLPGDRQKPQVSETQQCCWWEGSAGWCGQQNQQSQWQGADAQDDAVQCNRCLTPLYLSASPHWRNIGGLTVSSPIWRAQLESSCWQRTASSWLTRKRARWRPAFHCQTSLACQSAHRPMASLLLSSKRWVTFPIFTVSPTSNHSKISSISGALVCQGDSANISDWNTDFLPQTWDLPESHWIPKSNKSICGCIFSAGAVLEVQEYIFRHYSSPFVWVDEGSTSYRTKLNFWDNFGSVLTSGVSLCNQRRLLTQQRSSDRDHHQTPPHRGHGCRQGGAQHRHLGRVRRNKSGEFPPAGRCFTCSLLCGRFLVQFKQDKVCVKFIQGASKNGNGASCKRKNNRLLEVLVPSMA